MVLTIFLQLGIQQSTQRDTSKLARLGENEDTVSVSLIGQHVPDEHHPVLGTDPVFPGYWEVI